MILVDTNVLVQAVNSASPHHGVCRALVDAVRSRTVAAAVTPQVLLEFFALVTDPRRVNNPLAPEEAWRQVQIIRTVFQVLDAGAKTLDYLHAALQEKKTRGADVFDVYLVAQMRAANISVICTYNLDDFAYAGITAQTPESLAAF